MINLDSLHQSDNVCIFIRHGEKNINSYDLSIEGKIKSSEFADKLYSLGKQVNIFSSPEQRCIETAAIISNKINGESSVFFITDVLGKPGIQVKSKTEYAKLTDTMRCRDIFVEWKNKQHYGAMYKPETLREKIITFFKRTAIRNGISLYISQSGTVACTGYSLNLTDYNNTDYGWVNYLDGYIFRLENEINNI